MVKMKSVRLTLILFCALCGGFVGCRSSVDMAGDEESGEEEVMDSQESGRRMETAAPQPMDSSRATRMAQLPAIEFPREGYELSRAEVKKVRAAAEFLKSRSERVLLTAAADGLTAEYSRQLGEIRLRIVAALLRDEGIPAERIVTVSYGEDAPRDAPAAAVSFALLKSGGEKAP